MGWTASARSKHVSAVTVAVPPGSQKGEFSRAAIHEVGHAAIAVLVGRTVCSVRLRPRPETVVAPRALPRGRPKTDADRALLESEVMVTVAGIAAERVFGLARDAAGALDDLSRAADLAVRLSGPARAEATVGHFLSVVERMLQGRRTQLAAAARALQASGHLQADDVKARLHR